MKKILKTLTLSLIFIPFIAGCKAPVFYEIMRDVAPEEATVNGVITSVTRYTSSSDEKLVTFSSDGLIWKDANGTAHGQWSCFPDSNQLSGKIIKTAADDSNLYVVTITFHEDVEKGLNLPDAATLWCYAEESWNKVENTPELLPGNFNIFCTNDVEKDNRSAYLRIGDKVYKLNGTTFNESNPQDGNYNSVVSGDNDIFFESTASVKTSVKNGNYIYWGEGSKLYYSNNTSNPKAEGNKKLALDAGTDISCLAATKDALLIGRGDFSNSLISKGGIAKTSLKDGVPGNSLESFSTNATSQLASVYQIYTLLVANPEQTELEASIYASMGFKGSGSSTSVSYDNIGLWSYYPARGNWNRE